MSAKKVIKAIKKYSEFLITSHVGLEGDALGSELAFASLLKKLGKKAYVVNDSRVPANYAFLPGAKRVYHLKDIGRMRRGKRAFPVMIVLDCPNIERIGNVARLIKKQTLIPLSLISTII
jgi:phosphoesterase RecJ-like protein